MKTKTVQEMPRSFWLVIGLPIIFWAFAFPFIRLGLEELSPLSLTVLRLFISCAIFLCLIALMPRKFSPIVKRDIPVFFFLGLGGIVIYHLGLNYGEQFVSPSAASLIIATIPIFVVILATILLKETLTRRIVGGILCSLVGVMVISLFGTPTATFEIQYLVAALAILLAAILGAGYTITGKFMLSRYSPLSLTTYAFLFGSLGLIPLLNSTVFEEVRSLSLQGWGVVLFLGFCPTVIAYVLWYAALSNKGASELSVFLYAIPVLSTILTYIIFKEPITWMFLGGGIVVIVGLVIVNRRKMLPSSTIKV